MQIPDPAPILPHKDQDLLLSQHQNPDRLPLQSPKTQLPNYYDRRPVPEINYLPGTYSSNPPKMVYEGGNFGATIFHQQEGAWGTFHQIGPNGEIADPFRQDLKNFGQNLNGGNSNHRIDENRKQVLQDSHGRQIRDCTLILEVQLNAASKFGLAAGKIYIKVTEGCTKTMSDFWFEKRFFFTCAHFMRRLPHDAPSKDDLVKNLEKPQSNMTTTPLVATKFYSKEPGMKCSCFIMSWRPNSALVDQDCKIVTLLKLLHDEDIAIFKLTVDEPDLGRYIRKDQLHSITDHSPSTLTIFTAAYNGNDTSVNDSLLEESDKKSPLGKQHNHSVFEYLCARYQNALRKDDLTAYKAYLSVDEKVSGTRVKTHTLAKHCTFSRHQRFMNSTSRTIEISRSVSSSWPPTRKMQSTMVNAI